MEYYSLVNILIIGHLNFLSDNFKICVISESGSDVYFVSSDSVFFLPLAHLVTFGGKPDMMYCVKGTERNGPFV